MLRDKILADALRAGTVANKILLASNPYAGKRSPSAGLEEFQLLFSELASILGWVAIDDEATVPISATSFHNLLTAVGHLCLVYTANPSEVRNFPSLVENVDRAFQALIDEIDMEEPGDGHTSVDQLYPE